MNYLNILVTIKTRTRRTFLSRRTSSGYNTSPLRGYKIFTNLFYQDIRWRKKDMKKENWKRKKKRFHLLPSSHKTIHQYMMNLYHYNLEWEVDKDLILLRRRSDREVWHLEVAKINRWIFFTWIAYSFCLIRWRLDRVENR